MDGRKPKSKRKPKAKRRLRVIKTVRPHRRSAHPRHTYVIWRSSSGSRWKELRIVMESLGLSAIGRARGEPETGTQRETACTRSPTRGSGRARRTNDSREAGHRVFSRPSEAPEGVGPSHGDATGFASGRPTFWMRRP